MSQKKLKKTRTRRKALRALDIIDISEWNKTEDGKGKTLKHVRWIPSESCYNVPERFINVFKARDQKDWILDCCNSDPVKMVMFAIEKGALHATPNRKSRLKSHKIECFFYLNGCFPKEEVSLMIKEYNNFCYNKSRTDLMIETTTFKTKEVKKDIFDTFLDRH